MESMLHKLYFGNISPWDRKRVCGPEHTALIEKIDSIDMHFKKLLSPEEYAKFQEIQSLQAEADISEEEALFGYAFSTGALLMIEVFGYSQRN